MCKGSCLLVGSRQAKWNNFLSEIKKNNLKKIRDFVLFI